MFFYDAVFSASKWNRFFKSKFLAAISRQAQIYFYLVIGVLVIFLLEAIREMRKYSNMGKLKSEAHKLFSLNLAIFRRRHNS